MKMFMNQNITNRVSISCLGGFRLKYLINNLTTFNIMFNHSIHTSKTKDPSFYTFLNNSNYKNLVFDNNNKSILFVNIKYQIIDVIKNLKDGYYTFHFYPYIRELDEKDGFFFKNNNENLILVKNGSSYKSFMSLILKIDRENK